MDGGIQRKEKRMDVEQALGRLAPELRRSDTVNLFWRL